MLSPSAYLARVKGLFQQHGDPERAPGQMRYMRNQFEFYGLKAPQWMALAWELFRDPGIPVGAELAELVRLCYEDEYRELQYFATEMVQRALRKQPPEFIDLLEWMITTKSWWDTVDWLAKLAGLHFRRYPHLTRPVTARWIDSDDLWLQRSAILFQLTYKNATDAALLFDYILRRASSTEFFIQKSAGWALREYSKTDAAAVTGFIEKHDLPPLTKREGLKWLKNQGKL